MSVLPDELWRRILEMGIQNSTLTHKDLCCLSICCRHLRRISREDFLWTSLFSVDFPNHQPNNKSSSSKILYKERYEKDKAQKALAQRRAILRVESEVAQHVRKIREIELQFADEKQKIKNCAAELTNLHRVRQASVALNVWQPDVIRGRQKQIVQQCNVPIDSRIATLEMELRLCEQQASVLDKSLRGEKKRLDEAKQRLASVKYHPLQEFDLTSSKFDKHLNRRKKLKRQ